MGAVSLSKLKRGFKLILKNNEEVLFLEKMGKRLKVLGPGGLKSISRRDICLDRMSEYYSDIYYGELLQ